VILVDGNNLAFRSFYAFRQLSFEEEHTGTYYGFLGAHARLKAKYGDSFVYCFDSKESWRKGVYPAYKSKRAEKEEDPEKANVRTVHIPKLMDVLSLLGYPVLQYRGLEADDLLSLQLQSLRKQGASRVYVYSGDRDLYQLLRFRCATILRPVNGAGVKRYTATSLREEFGVGPELWAKALALGVDTSDSIKAIPGVGPTTAIRMLLLGADPSRSWEKQPPEFRAKYGKTAAHWDNARLAYKLTKLPTEAELVPIPAQDRMELGALLNSVSMRRNPDPRVRPLFLDFCAQHGLSEFRHDRSKFLQ